KADSRLVLRPSEIDSLARALAAKVGVAVQGGRLNEDQQKWVDAVAADLQEHKGKCLVVPGEFQSPAVHALAHAMNAALKSVGQTVTYIDPVEVDPVEHGQSIRELIADLNAGKVTTLIIIGGNPVFNTPVDLGFEEALKTQLEKQEKERTLRMCVQLSRYK